MQQNETTKKIEQIEKVSKNSNEINENIWQVMDKFNLMSILKPLNVIKCQCLKYVDR